MSFVGKLFSSGRSAAKRAAEEARKQTELQRQALEASQREFELEQAQRAEQHAALLAQQEAQSQAAIEASRLAQEETRRQLEATQLQQQAQLALQQQDKDVVEILPQGTTEEFDTGRKNRKRPPISLGGVGGIFGL